MYGVFYWIVRVCREYVFYDLDLFVLFHEICPSGYEK